MDVRLARPTDAPLVFSLALDEGAHLVRTPSWPAKNPVARSVARALFPLTLPGRLWIVRDGRTVLLLEIAPRSYVIGYDIVRLVGRGDPECLLGAALRAATAHLQSKGVPRLFARGNEQASQMLRAFEFQPMAREYILLGPVDAERGESELPPNSRYRIPADAWPLHQLESALTPPLVRQVEGLTSVDWSKTAKEMSEIVVEQDGKLVAWAGWGTRIGPRHASMSLMLDPEYADLGPDLVRHALKQVRGGCRLVARARDYQVEAVRALTQAGFQIAGEEVVLLKHAGVELARAEKKRLNVAPLPSVQGFNVRGRCEPVLRVNALPDIGKKTICDGIA